MRNRSLARILVIALTVLFVIGGTVLAQAEEKAQTKKKRPQLIPQQGTAQTQTAPAAAGQTGKPGEAKGKSKAPKDPKEAGWMTVQGRIVTVHPEQHAVIIRTSVTEYRVFVNSQTQLTRDGQSAEIKALRTNDTVDGCQFNAKHVAKSLKVTSAERNLQVPPKPSKQ